MYRVLLFILAMLGLFANADAAPVVRLVQYQKTCNTQACTMVGHCWSGFSIGQSRDARQVVLTCAHAFDRELPVRIENGKQHATGDIIALDVEHDLGLVACRTHEAWLEESLTVANSLPDQRARVRIQGYGPSGTYRDRATTAKGLLCVNGQDALALDAAMLLVDAKWFQGESGGAVLYEGQVVGVIWGYHPSRRDSLATPLPVVETFLRKHLVCIPRSATYCEPCGKKPVVRVPPPPIVEPQYIDPRAYEPLPIAPMPDPVFSHPPQPKQPDIMGALNRIEQRFSDLEQRIAGIKTEPGPPGPPGKDGADGKPGLPGKNAEPLPITVVFEVIGLDGKVMTTKEETFAPGEPIVLRYRQQQPNKTPVVGKK